MSLDELLKPPESGSLWGFQRRKLFRLGLAILVTAIALIGGTAWILSLKRSPPPPAPHVSGDGRDLAKVMRLKNEADELKADIRRLRAPSSSRPSAPRGRSTERVISYDPGDGFLDLRAAKSDLYIPTGAVFQAQLLTPIKTSLEKTFVMAETTNEYRMDMKRRIPRGSRLIGRSRFDPVLKGVVVEFDTVVFPNGIESSIAGLALSRNALPEIDGLYFSDKLTTYGTALAFGFLSGFAGAGVERDYTLLGSQPLINTQNQVLAGLSTASFQVADQILHDIQTHAIEYVVVPAGERVFVVLTRKYEIAQGGPK